MLCLPLVALRAFILLQLQIFLGSTQRTEINSGELQEDSTIALQILTSTTSVKETLLIAVTFDSPQFSLDNSFKRSVGLESCCT
jgi:hypothetical protein